jgi:hypothetical protein
LLLRFFKFHMEANRHQERLDEEQRTKWFGLLHPDTGTTSLYNQLHMLFLMYMLAVLPVRAAFGLVPVSFPWTPTFVLLV